MTYASERFLVLLGLLGIVGSIGGCQDSTPALPNTRVGTLCRRNSQCTYTIDETTGKRTQVQICAHVLPPDGEAQEDQPRICTRLCKARTDCPVGFECLYSPDVDDKLCLPCRADYDCPASTFCQAQPASMDMGEGEGEAVDMRPTTLPKPTRCMQQTVANLGDFGKDCPVDLDGSCNTARGFFCHQEVRGDAKAYCTKTCMSDADCAPSMFCGTAAAHNYPSGKTRRCLKRTLCSDCRRDSECNDPATVCVADNRGRGYCTKRCNPSSRGPCTLSGPLRGPYECKAVTPLSGGPKVPVCVPRYGRLDDNDPNDTGRCYGDGQTCAPCRPRTPSDCKSGRCVTDQFGESLCLQTCKGTNECNNPALKESILRCTTPPEHPPEVGDREQVCAARNDLLSCWP